MQKIKSSLDWNLIETNLTHKARGLVHERDIRRMINNIRTEVTQLSKAEVAVRSGRIHAAEDLLEKINNDMEVLEGFLLVAALLG